MSAFHPVAWLASFEAVGGWYVVNERDITLGWRVFGVDETAQIEARALYNEIANDPERRRQVRAFIMDSHRGLAPLPD